MVWRTRPSCSAIRSASRLRLGPRGRRQLRENPRRPSHPAPAPRFVHLITDGHASEDVSAGNTALINARRNGGDLLNVFGDFPTPADPRHADAYSPLWDAQLGLWTDKAVKA